MQNITVQTKINAPVEKVWDYYITPEHVTHWNNASEDWHTPKASNDFEIGGKFAYRMEAKDGSAGFDFEGVYNSIEKYQLIEYTMPDGRRVRVEFLNEVPEVTKVIVTFQAEEENSLEMQQNGWQSILDNFRSYVENGA